MYKPVSVVPPLASRPHDHSHCVSHALAEAEAICARQGLRLTALRKRVLCLLYTSPSPRDVEESRMPSSA